MDVEPWSCVVELVPEFVVVVVDDDDEDEDVDPGRFKARARAPATPETPTAEVTRFIRARSRLRALFGCSDNAGCTAALRPLGSLVSLIRQLSAAPMSEVLCETEGNHEKSREIP